MSKYPLLDKVSAAVIGVTSGHSSDASKRSIEIAGSLAIEESLQHNREICRAQLKQFLGALRPLLLRNGVSAAWIFGSRARGTAVPESDIDVMMVARTDRAFVDRFRDYMPALLESNLGVDMLVYIPEEFKRMRTEERPFIVDALEEALPINVGR